MIGPAYSSKTHDISFRNKKKSGDNQINKGQEKSRKAAKLTCRNRYGRIGQHGLDDVRGHNFGDVVPLEAVFGPGYHPRQFAKHRLQFGVFGDPFFLKTAPKHRERAMANRAVVNPCCQIRAVNWRFSIVSSRSFLFHGLLGIFLRRLSGAVPCANLAPVPANKELGRTWSADRPPAPCQTTVGRIVPLTGQTRFIPIVRR